MKQKHAELIHKWADGAVIQYLSPNNEWKDALNNNPTWNANETYRVKPVLATWQLNLIKAVKEGKEVEWYSVHQRKWMPAEALYYHVKNNTEKYAWNGEDDYRIVEPNVYMWAYFANGDWHLASKLMTETQAKKELATKPQVEKIRQIHTI